MDEGTCALPFAHVASVGYATLAAMSALPPKADIPQRRLDVRFVPIADQVQRNKIASYSITSSVSAMSEGGTGMPSASAVLRLITNANFVGCIIGSSPGFAPFRILST
jgi:hypothetical protein